MKIKACILLFLFAILSMSCETENHIEKYEVRIDSLQILPNGFYAYRRGRIYYTSQAKNHRIWFNFDSLGNVGNIVKIDTFQTKNNHTVKAFNQLKIDTLEYKIVMQKFVDLSKKFKFGHLRIDKTNKISFSYKQYLEFA